MPRPVRIQLSRAKGFSLQEHSRAINGLAAVNCTMPSKWGNPYRVGVDGWTAKDCIAAYRGMVLGCMPLEELRGKNLGCFCKPGDLCHADTLLELANR
jgi:hypothetical protein